VSGPRILLAKPGLDGHDRGLKVVRDAGCNAVQEVALTMASAVAYRGEFLARGMDFEAFAPRLSFHFADTVVRWERTA
jgi:methylmalonyl-CoA mutase, N-terminal domain